MQNFFILLPKKQVLSYLLYFFGYFSDMNQKCFYKCIYSLWGGVLLSNIIQYLPVMFLFTVAYWRNEKKHFTPTFQLSHTFVILKTTIIYPSGSYDKDKSQVYRIPSLFFYTSKGHYNNVNSVSHESLHFEERILCFPVYGVNSWLQYS